jgi:hypothetical protein
MRISSSHGMRYLGIIRQSIRFFNNELVIISTESIIIWYIIAGHRARIGASLLYHWNNTNYILVVTILVCSFCKLGWMVQGWGKKLRGSVILHEVQPMQLLRMRMYKQAAHLYIESSLHASEHQYLRQTPIHHA